MTTHNVLSAALIGAALIATPAIARTSYVIPRYHAQNANASASPAANHIHGSVGISASHVSVFRPAPPDGQNCDVGDNPRIC